MENTGIEKKQEGKTEETNFFDRLKLEHDSLMERHIRLTKFLSTANREELNIPEEEWNLLKLQEMTMKQYGFILERRINLITNRLNNESVS